MRVSWDYDLHGISEDFVKMLDVATPVAEETFRKQMDQMPGAVQDLAYSDSWEVYAIYLLGFLAGMHFQRQIDFGRDKYTEAVN